MQATERRDFVVRYFDWKMLKRNAKRAKAVLSFVVSYNPVDRPNKYVVRPFFATEKDVKPLPVIIVGKSYESVVERIPIEELELICFAREEADDNVIIETWL